MNDTTGRPTAGGTGENPADTRTIAERLAVLEDRTSPANEGFWDKLKAWGGVISLVIAIGYSFPLGLWDRFVVSEAKQQALELRDLRGVLAQASEIMVDHATSISAITDPQLRDSVSRAANTRIFLLMHENSDRFKERKGDFVPAEVLAIGYNFLLTNQLAEAIDFFEQAKSIAEDDVLTRIEAARMLGKAYFFPSDIRDIEQARTAYREAIQLGQGSANMQLRYSALTAQFDWGLFELSSGDWQCGQELIDNVKAIYYQIAAQLNDQGHLLNLVQASTANAQRKPGQAASGCANP